MGIESEDSESSVQLSSDTGKGFQKRLYLIFGRRLQITWEVKNL